MSSNPRTLRPIAVPASVGSRGLASNLASTLRLALRMLKRDWRAGELRVLIAALVLAAASVGTVGFFADRVKGALTGQANTLLGADLMLSGDRPLPDQFEREALARKLAVTPVLKF